MYLFHACINSATTVVPKLCVILCYHARLYCSSQWLIYISIYGSLSSGVHCKKSEWNDDGCVQSCLVSVFKVDIFKVAQWIFSRLPSGYLQSCPVDIYKVTQWIFTKLPSNCFHSCPVDVYKVGLWVFTKLPSGYLQGCPVGAL